MVMFGAMITNCHDTPGSGVDENNMLLGVEVGTFVVGLNSGIEEDKLELFPMAASLFLFELGDNFSRSWFRDDLRAIRCFFFASISSDRGELGPLLPVGFWGDSELTSVGLVGGGL